MKNKNYLTLYAVDQADQTVEKIAMSYPMWRRMIKNYQNENEFVQMGLEKPLHFKQYMRGLDAYDLDYIASWKILSDDRDTNLHCPIFKDIGIFDSDHYDISEFSKHHPDKHMILPLK